MSIRSALFCCLTAALSVPAAAQNHELFGSSFLGGTVYRVDPADASSVVVGTTGFPNIGAVCKDATGQFWAHSNFQRKLLKLDGDTGVGTDIANTFRTVRGMDFVGGTLYVIADGGFNNNDRLYTMNTVDGTSILIGTTSHERIEAFCFANGTAYAWDQVAGLVTVDLANGSTVNVSGANDGGFDIHALAVSPSGQLYGAWEELYTIDAATGVHTMVDDLLGFSELDGMVFQSYNDCLDLDVTNLEAGQIATLSTSGPADGAFIGMVYGVQQGATPVLLPGLVCATFGIDPAGIDILAIGTVVGGSYDVALPLPAGLSGALLYVQSAQFFTCPGECLSNLKAKIL